MVERRLTRRDQAGLLRASLLASASGARETHAARETTVAGASFFAFLSHITRSHHKQCISHQTSDRSPEARTGADTQRVVYTRALLQVGWGGSTMSSMSGDTNVRILLVRWAFDTYIRCLQPQLLCCMPLHVMFPLPTTSLHLVRPSPCCMCWRRTKCTVILVKYMYVCAYPT